MALPQPVQVVISRKIQRICFAWGLVPIAIRVFFTLTRHLVNCMHKLILFQFISNEFINFHIFVNFVQHILYTHGQKKISNFPYSGKNLILLDV